MPIQLETGAENPTDGSTLAAAQPQAAPQNTFVITNPTAWEDLGVVYEVAGGDAYYPDVIYNVNGFGSGSAPSKMWYSNGQGQVFQVSSSDSLSWSVPITMTGLGGDAHHVQVVYNAAGLPGSPAPGFNYQIWYWDINELYSIEAIATAWSEDGINWVDDQPIAQSETGKLVTGTWPAWNYGSYGPVDVSYQPGTGYRMYFNGTNGANEYTGLATSIDGLFWTAASATPVLRTTVGAWDCSDAVYGTVLQDAVGYHYWYSGGGGLDELGNCVDHPVHEGIGYAFSPDGLTWTKNSNPIFHISDGVSYRNQRVYTPAVVNDGSGLLKMYYSAQGDGGWKKIGLAVQKEPLVDLDIDSDNNDGFRNPSRTIFEEIIEDDPNRPGKYIPVNFGNKDYNDWAEEDHRDYIPDFADGFNYDNRLGTKDDIMLKV